MGALENGTDSNGEHDFAELAAAFHGFEICREPWNLYYDETENCRSVSYGSGAIRDARADERDFILGASSLLSRA